MPSRYLYTSAVDGVYGKRGWKNESVPPLTFSASTGDRIVQRNRHQKPQLLKPALVPMCKVANGWILTFTFV